MKIFFFSLNEPSVKENVSFKIMYTEKDYNYDQLVEFVKDFYHDKTGIIYCKQKEDCFLITRKLKEVDIRSFYIHENTSDDDKSWIHWISSNGVIIHVRDNIF